MFTDECYAWRLFFNGMLVTGNIFVFIVPLSISSSWSSSNILLGIFTQRRCTPSKNPEWSTDVPSQFSMDFLNFLKLNDVGVSAVLFFTIANTYMQESYALHIHLLLP